MMCSSRKGTTGGLFPFPRCLAKCPGPTALTVERMQVHSMKKEITDRSFDDTCGPPAQVLPSEITSRMWRASGPTSTSRFHCPTQPTRSAKVGSAAPAWAPYGSMLWAVSHMRGLFWHSRAPWRTVRIHPGCPRWAVGGAGLTRSI